MPGLWWEPGRGLSPRVRGNQALACVSPETTGSIPACAGEPSGEESRPQRCMVYPRVCGGTVFCQACG